MKRWGIAIVLVGGLLTACGDGRTDESARAAGIAPADVLAFFSVSLDPSIEQKRNLLSLAKAFPDSGIEGEFGEARDKVLSDLASEAGLDYEKDIKPAIGDEVSLAVFPPAAPGDEPPAAVIVEIDDRQAAEKLAAGGNEDVAYRIVGDHLIATQPGPGADAVFARFNPDSGAPTLAGSEAFERLTGELHGDRLLLGWVDLPRLARLTQDEAEDISPLADLDFEEALGSSGPAAFDLHAESGSLVFEAVAAATGEENAAKPELTEGLPSDVLAALTYFDLGKALAQVVDPLSDFAEQEGGDLEAQLGLDPQRDILPWLGDEVVLAVGPVGESGFPDLAVLVRPSDRAAAEAGELKIIGAAEALTGPLTRLEVAGARAHTVSVDGADLPIRPTFGLLRDRFVFATSPEYYRRVAEPAQDSLGETDGYQAVIDRATSGATQGQVVIDIDAIREALETAFELKDDPEYVSDTLPKVEPLDHFGLRMARVGDLNRFRAVLTVS